MLKSKKNQYNSLKNKKHSFWLEAHFKRDHPELRVGGRGLMSNPTPNKKGWGACCARAVLCGDVHDPAVTCR